MILTPPELELILILRENHNYPRNKEELYLCIKKLDENHFLSDRVLKKIATPIFSIEEFFNTLSDRTIESIKKNII